MPVTSNSSSTILEVGQLRNKENTPPESYGTTHTRIMHRYSTYSKRAYLPVELAVIDHGEAPQRLDGLHGPDAKWNVAKNKKAEYHY